VFRGLTEVPTVNDFSSVSEHLNNQLNRNTGYILGLHACDDKANEETQLGRSRVGRERDITSFHLNHCSHEHVLRRGVRDLVIADVATPGSLGIG
jgi:hypothetical protein